MPRLFVIGGSDAGVSAALRARELAPEWEVSVAVADRFPDFSICGIPYYLSGETQQAGELAHGHTDDIRKVGVKLLLELPAIKSDPTARKVVINGPSAGESIERYDRLIVAIGAAPIQPPIRGADLSSVFFLRLIVDALAFHRFPEDRAPRTVAIVGGGYIGLEVAEALRRRLIEVIIVEMASSVMTTIDADLGSKARAELEKNGVRLAPKRSVSSIVADAGRLRLEAPDGSHVLADMAIRTIALGDSIGVANSSYKPNLAK